MTMDYNFSAEIVGGQLTPLDSISFSFIAKGITPIGKLLNWD